MAANLQLHLLDITIKLPTASDIDKVLNGVQRSINEGICKNATYGESGRVINVFKVVGESRVISVLEGSVEGAFKELCNSRESLEVKCTPLRTYEQFAARVLNVEEYKSLPTPTHSLQTPLNNRPPHFYWLQFDVGYRGRSFDEFMNIWRSEASTALAMRTSGKRALNMYKTVAQKQVHAFVNCPDEETMDDLTFTLPGVVEKGGDVHITAKSLLPTF